MPNLCQELLEADTDYRHSSADGFRSRRALQCAISSDSLAPTLEAHVTDYRFEYAKVSEYGEAMPTETF